MENNQFSNMYLKGCEKVLERLDKLGNSDGVVSIDEIKKLEIFEDKDLNNLAIEIITKFANQDGDNIASPEEYASALNSKEYNDLLEQFYLVKQTKRAEVEHSQETEMEAEAETESEIKVASLKPESRQITDDDIAEMMSKEEFMTCVKEYLLKIGKDPEKIPVSELKEVVKSFM